MGAGPRASVRIQLLIWDAYVYFAPSATSARNQSPDIMTKGFCLIGNLHTRLLRAGRIILPAHEKQGLEMSGTAEATIRP